MFLYPPVSVSRVWHRCAGHRVAEARGDPLHIYCKFFTKSIFDCNIVQTFSQSGKSLHYVAERIDCHKAVAGKCSVSPCVLKPSFFRYTEINSDCGIMDWFSDASIVRLSELNNKQALEKTVYEYRN